MPNVNKTYYGLDWRNHYVGKGPICSLERITFFLRLLDKTFISSELKSTFCQRQKRCYWHSYQVCLRYLMKLFFSSVSRVWFFKNDTKLVGQNMICLFKEIIFNNLDEDSNDTESDKITLFFKQQLDSLANILRYICFSFPIAYYIIFFIFSFCVWYYFSCMICIYNCYSFLIRYYCHINVSADNDEQVEKMRTFSNF